MLAVAATLALPLAAGCAGILAVDPEPRRRVTIVAGLALAAAPVFAGPIAASLLVSGSHNFVTIRYTLPLALIGTLACGYVLSRAPVRLLVPALAIGAALSLSYAARKNEFASASRAGQETREAAAWLRDRVRPGDRVVTEPPWDWFTLAYYRVPELVKPQALVDGGPGAGPNPSPGLGTTWTVYFTPGEGPGPSAAGPNGGARFGTILITSAGERSGR